MSASDTTTAVSRAPGDVGREPAAARSATPGDASTAAPDVGPSPSQTGSIPAVVTVTAVVVTHGHTPYLAATLKALRGQTLGPDRVVVVDVGASESMRDHRDLHLGDARFVVAPHTRSFGQAVDAALADEPVGDRASTWTWLLHDDSAPEPDALERQLVAVEHTSSVGIAGAKQRGWENPDVLLEVGFTTSPLGRRMTGIDVAEIDQGQHDGRDDVFAVGLAGALVRTSLWTDLGGTDPEYGAFGDGLDLCRRARLAGHRVVVVPGAVVRHAQASLRGLRDGHRHGGGRPDASDTSDAPSAPSAASATDAPSDTDTPSAPDDAEAGAPADAQAAPVRQAQRRRPDIDSGPGNTYLARRRSQMYYRLVRAPLVVVPFLLVGTLLWSPLRAMYRLAVKQPAQAVDEVLAAVVVVLRLVPLARARRSIRRTSTQPRSTLRPLVATWREVVAERQERRQTRAARLRARYAPTEIERAELRALAVRRWVGFSVVLLALLGLTAWVFGPWLGTLGSGGRLVGGSLLTADSTLGDLWRSATSGWITSGLGEPGPNDPLLLALVPFTVLVGGGLQTAVDTLMVTSFVVAGLGAWFAAGAATRSVWLRGFAVAAWVVAPPLLVGVSDGRLGSVLAHAALPWAVLGVARAVGAQATDRIAAVVSGKPGTPGASGRRSRRDVPGSLGAAAAGGLALALTLAAAPSLVLPAAVLLVVVAITARTGRRYLWLVPVPSLVLLLPYLVEVATTWSAGGWRLLAADPGLPLATDPGTPWQALLGWVSTPSAWFVADGVAGVAAGLAPYALGGLLVLAALAALLRRARVTAARAAWVCVVLALVLLLVVTSTTVAVDPATGTRITGSGGPAASLLVLGLLAAALLGLRRRYDGELAPTEDATSSGTRGRKALRGLRNVGVGLVVAACTIVPLATGWAWVHNEVDRPTGDDPGTVGMLEATSATVVPPVGQQMQSAPAWRGSSRWRPAPTAPSSTHSCAGTARSSSTRRRSCACAASSRRSPRATARAVTTPSAASRRSRRTSRRRAPARSRSSSPTSASAGSSCRRPPTRPPIAPSWSPGSTPCTASNV
ncbi:hypothetical protein GCM10025865_21490 [Paraoerskovia sediminicola]|uniref:GT2 family glycosyltransferase n=1 Tax=Paraoerskovia sediminicola TaxID=1138587 RepID=A0ABM8G473_9CELL|nr:glycosyltransferase [Paraoerskovia sediminicola]BDZ42850.1 hypothetical protein GCM10025865_21490 [Paraoerskovia sediminicola]